MRPSFTLRNLVLPRVRFGVTANSRLLRPSYTSLSLPNVQRSPQVNEYHRPLQQIRTQTTQSTSSGTGSQEVPPGSPPPQTGKGALSPIFTLLLVAGLGAIGYGVYDIYGTLTLWPPEVRKDLRLGLRAKHKGDLDLAVWYFTRAWEISKTLSVSTFGPTNPHLKTSGIAIALAEILELDHKPDRAFSVYVDALKRLQDADTKEADGNEGQPNPDPELSPQERMRAISISYKLGELAQALGREKEEEEYLTWAVEAILHISNAQATQPSPSSSTPSNTSSTYSNLDNSTASMLSDLSLSPWATKTDLAAPFEALGSFYAQHGKEHFALPLYLHAISILIPPPPGVSGREERCRGAQLMSNLSELILRRSGTDLTQAESWALKALDIATHTRQQKGEPEPMCEVAYAVALFNVAAIRRMAGDNEKAKMLLEMSKEQSEAIGMQEGVEHAKEALEQIRLEGRQVKKQI